MNRRQLVFVVVLNALVSLVIALAVAWAIEARRPDSELLQIVATPVFQITNAPPAVVAEVAATLLPTPAAAGENGGAETANEEAAPIATVDPTTQQIYTIQAGDSLSAVAERFGTTIDAIMKTNELTDPNVVFVGQRLIIPVRATSGNGAAPSSGAESPTPAPLVAGEGTLIRKVDGPGVLLTEAVQVVNDSDAIVSLKGWQLERENGPAYTFGELSIFPGGNIWIHTANGDDTSVALYWDQAEPVWQSGSVARLLDSQGNEINRYVVP